MPLEILSKIPKIIGCDLEWLLNGEKKTKSSSHPYPLRDKERVLQGLKALVTSGPTYEPIDPVRFLGNRSSGKQGHAIAQALHNYGATVTLITGPVSIPDPIGPGTIHIQTAAEMLKACQKALPSDIAVLAAAVSDWTPSTPINKKIKKQSGKNPPEINLKENPDILKTIATSKNRPALIIGFAAETENVIENAKIKLEKKKCDWIIANEVGHQKTFGSDENHVYLITKDDATEWPQASKIQIAEQLVDKIIEFMNTTTSKVK